MGSPGARIDAKTGAAVAAAAAAPGPGLAGWLARHPRYRYIVAAADQIAISLLNFGLTFALLRILSTTEFGTISLWLAVANLAISVHTALVGGPLGIHLPSETDGTRRRRLGEAMASVNLLLAFGTVALIAVANGTVSDAEWAPKTPLAAAMIPLFVGAGLFREYYRSIAFGRQDMALLLAIDLPYLVVTTGGVAAMLLSPHQFASLTGAFVALAAGMTIGPLCGFWRLRGQDSPALRRGWLAAYRGVSNDTGWALTGVVFAHVQERSYVYVITSFVGLAEVGALNAVAMLFRPGQILLTAWRRSALPELATAFAEGRVAELDRRLLSALAVALGGCAAWFAALWAGWHLIAVHLFAGKYPDAYLLLLPWATAVACDTVDFILSAALQAAREFRYLACATLVSAPSSAAAVVALTLWHGYTWTIYGLAVGNGLSALMFGVRLLAVRRRLAAGAAAAAAPAAAAPDDAAEMPRPAGLS